MKKWLVLMMVLGIIGYAIYAWAFTPGRDTQPVSGTVTAQNTNAAPIYTSQSTTGGWSVTGNTTSATNLTVTKAASVGRTWKPQKVLISSYSKCKWQVTINDVVVWRGLIAADAVGQQEFDLPPLAGADNQAVALVVTTWDGSVTTWIDASMGGIE